MNNLNLLFRFNLNGKVRIKHEWNCVIESTCLVTSLPLVQARMVKTCPKKVNKNFFCTLNNGQLPTLLM